MSAIAISEIQTIQQNPKDEDLMLLSVAGNNSTIFETAKTKLQYLKNYLATYMKQMFCINENTTKQMLYDEANVLFHPGETFCATTIQHTGILDICVDTFNNGTATNTITLYIRRPDGSSESSYSVASFDNDVPGNTNMYSIHILKGTRIYFGLYNSADAPDSTFKRIRIALLHNNID